MKEFIVSTDLYEISDANVYTSYHLAKVLDLKPKLYFVDTLSPMIEKTFHPQGIQTNYIPDPVWKKEYEVTVLKKISDQLTRLGLPKKEFEFEVYEGSVSNGIKHLRQHGDLGLLSVGASDQSEINRLFFNTFAEKVFLNLDKECLVVKKKDDQFKNVYLLINLFEKQDGTIAKMIDVIKKLKAQLHIICIVDEDIHGMRTEAFPLETTGMYLKELERKLKKAGVDVKETTQLSLDHRIDKNLNRLLSETGTDLVIMSPRMHFLGSFSMTNETHHIIKHNNCNFYLFP